ncbi:phosphomevalonate kinase [Umbelopsis nana]
MTTVVSAPGKVLVTGGYLVLDPSYHGLVIGTNARFYTVIQPREDDTKRGVITVESPQFEESIWEYTCEISDNSVSILPGSSINRNKFVETCLRTCFRVLYEKLGEKMLVTKLGGGLRIVIVGDNDFYSQRLQLQERNLPTTMSSLRSLPPFCKTSTTLGKVHKTGLGSSAALITSLVAAIFVHFGAVASLTNKDDRVLVHNTAQQAHCLAQGKVGSGFDVSAAVWGSHRYRRFDPSVLEPAMDEQVDSKTLYSIVKSSHTAWDNVVTAVQLPPRLHMMLADIDAGSHTPTLVGKVLSWRKQSASESKALWDSLHSYNTKVEQDLRELNSLYEQDQQSYILAIDRLATKKASEWKSLADLGPVQAKLISLYENFENVRRLIRDMSEKSNVPIEPAEQTKLLDACMDRHGVIMAGVPGAGGYDAIFCITLSDEASSQVEDVWRTWTDMNVGPLLASEDSNGARIEDFNQVVGLADVTRN